MTAMKMLEKMAAGLLVRIACSALHTSMAGFGSLRVKRFGAEANQPTAAMAAPRTVIMAPVSGSWPVRAETRT